MPIFGIELTEIQTERYFVVAASLEDAKEKYKGQLTFAIDEVDLIHEFDGKMTSPGSSASTSGRIKRLFETIGLSDLREASNADWSSVIVKIVDEQSG